MNGMRGLAVIAAALALSACTWVELTAQGQAVRVLEAERVTACERLGKTTVNTTASVAGLKRHAEKVQGELDTLARNSAAEIGGDTVVPLGEPMSGRQVYEVYRCLPPADSDRQEGNPRQ